MITAKKTGTKTRNYQKRFVRPERERGNRKSPPLIRWWASQCWWCPMRCVPQRPHLELAMMVSRHFSPSTGACYLSFGQNRRLARMVQRKDSSHSSQAARFQLRKVRLSMQAKMDEVGVLTESDCGLLAFRTRDGQMLVFNWGVALSSCQNQTFERKERRNIPRAEARQLKASMFFIPFL